MKIKIQNYSRDKDMTNFFLKTYHRIRSESAEHLEETRETYCGHLRKNLGTSINLLYASVALIIHSAVPAWCKKAGYEIILREADNMEEHPAHSLKKDE